MLKRENRLAKVTKKKSSSFFNSAFFNIRISENKEKGLPAGNLPDGSQGQETRFGVVVSKKTSKKAVLRNKTKRIIRSIITDNLDKLAKGKDVIIVSKKTLNKGLKDKAEQDLLALFKKAKIMK